MADIDRLVKSLAAQVTPVKPAPRPLSLGLKWAGAAVAYLVVALLLAGPRPDLMQELQNPWFVAELLTLHFTSARSWSLQDWIATARSVDLDEQALVSIAGMHAATLARLLIASQSALLSRDFVADLAALGDCVREAQALKLRSTTTPVNVRSRWL